jgi:hypothetical protein
MLITGDNTEGATRAVMPLTRREVPAYGGLAFYGRQASLGMT